MWHWSSLLKGEDLSGKLFNQPPDGPYNSWYGHYKAPLVDPFAVTELSTCSSAVESSLLASEPKLLPTSEPKLRSIPKSVLNYISRVLNSNPEGISITHLRAELAKSNVDRDLYGYRKFSRFLSAMPHILELHRGDDGNIVVRRVNAKSSDELVLAASEESRTGNGEFEVCTDTKSNNKKNSCEDIVHKSTAGEVPGPKVIAELTNSHEAPKMEKQNDSSVSVKTHNIKMEARAGNVQDLNKENNKKAFLPKRNIQEILADRKVKLKTQPSTNEATLATPTVEVKDLSENNENDMVVPDDRSSAAEYGFFRGMWMKLFGNGDAKHDEALSGKDTDTQKTVMLCQSSEALRPALFSPSSHEALIDGKVALSGGATSDTPLQDSSLSWFKFRRSPKVDDNIEVNGEIADHPQVNINQLGENKVENDGEAAHVEVKSKQLELFAKESFWKEMESFIGTSQGSNIFSKSRTRESLAQNIQKQGPMDLRSVSISDLLHLIDLLILDKKWLEERADARYPFRVTHPAGKPVQNNLPSSNGLNHIFSDVQESKEKKYQNLSHTGVPQHIPRASSSKLKTEVLTDCKKLVDEIVKEHPKGFNIGGFRKLFFEKYGYALDLQKLGHEKFATLFKIMPGAVVVSNLILPRAALKNLNLQNAGQVGPVDDSHGDSLITSKEDEESDSWDELGPPDTSGSEKDEMDAQLTERSRKGTDQRLTFYEPLREDDFSDSEDEMSYTRSEDESKSKMSSESALLDILDSWHGQKQGNTKRDGSTSKNSGIDFVESGSNLSTNGSEVSKPTRKPKSQKSYSFVKEVDSKDKLINGILGSLNKSSDKSVDSKVMS